MGKIFEKMESGKKKQKTGLEFGSWRAVVHKLERASFIMGEQG